MQGKTCFLFGRASSGLNLIFIYLFILKRTSAILSFSLCNPMESMLVCPTLNQKFSMIPIADQRAFHTKQFCEQIGAQHSSIKQE